MCVESCRNYMELATLNLPKRLKAAHSPKTMPAGHLQGGDNRTAPWPYSIPDSPVLTLWWPPESLWEGTCAQWALLLTFPIPYSSCLGPVMLKFSPLCTIKQNKMLGLTSIMANTAHLQTLPPLPLSCTALSAPNMTSFPLKRTTGLYLDRPKQSWERDIACVALTYSKFLLDLYLLCWHFCAQELTAANSAQPSWGDAGWATALWKLWICNVVLLKNSSHRPHSTVGTLWTVINGAEQNISYWTYDRSFLVEAAYICVKNGCAAFEQITWRQTAVFLCLQRPHTTN